MILRTGTRGFIPPLRAGAGFTLIEVMFTVAVLCLGTLMVQAVLSRSAGLFGSTTRALAAQRWAEEKLWEERERIVYPDVPEPQDGSGSFFHGSREFRWRAQVRQEDEDLFKVVLTVDWEEGARPFTYSREQILSRASTRK